MRHVDHQTSPVTLIFEGRHTEQLRFFLYHSVHHPHIVGYSWFKFHNTHTDWSEGKVLTWGENWKENSFPAQQAPALHAPVSEDPDLARIPQCY